MGMVIISPFPSVSAGNHATADEIFEKCGPNAWGVIVSNGQKVCLRPRKGYRIAN
jgi:hypothetical protein